MKTTLTTLLALTIPAALLPMAVLPNAAAKPKLAAKPVLAGNPDVKETPAQFVRRTKWWREAKFGMFIHWGIYSVPADGEWHMYEHKMQVSDYEKYASQFDPVKFDAHKWVKAAKDAGMKYIVITSKHHDGFNMFDSHESDYNVVKDTPWHHDPMKDLAAECKKQGIRLCFYHSFMDWHNFDYLPRRPWDTRPTEGADPNRFIQYVKGELTDLLTNYGPIGVIWWDGGWEHNAAEEHSQEINGLIRKLQPNILINNRLSQPQDFDTPEQNIPASALNNGRLWETCMTLNNHWGYARDDHDWKSPEDLVHKLCDIASKGGNFLLNVGPTDLGEIPQPSIDNLERVGQWMKVNGRSIYDTTKSPYRKPTFDGRITTKGHTLYLQVFHWPAEGLKLAGLKTHVLSAHSLQDGKRLALAQQGEEVSIGKPAVLDPIATVVELRLAGAPVVEDVSAAIKPAADGTLTLSAADATITGGANVEAYDNVPSIGYWVNQADTVSWPVQVPQAGRYTVEIEYACEPGSAGSTFQVSSGSGAAVSGTVPNTGAWSTFKVDTLPGTLNLQAGAQTVTISATNMPHGAVMNLRRITLRPAP